jgi:hypothetical protein
MERHNIPSLSADDPQSSLPLDSHKFDRLNVAVAHHRYPNPLRGCQHAWDDLCAGVVRTGHHCDLLSDKRLSTEGLAEQPPQLDPRDHTANTGAYYRLFWALWGVGSHGGHFILGGVATKAFLELGKVTHSAPALTSVLQRYAGLGGEGTPTFPAANLHPEV